MEPVSPDIAKKLLSRDFANLVGRVKKRRQANPWRTGDAAIDGHRSRPHHGDQSCSVFYGSNPNVKGTLARLRRNEDPDNGPVGSCPIISMRTTSPRWKASIGSRRTASGKRGRWDMARKLAFLHRTGVDLKEDRSFFACSGTQLTSKPPSVDISHRAWLAGFSSPSFWRQSWKSSMRYPSTNHGAMTSL